MLGLMVNDPYVTEEQVKSIRLKTLVIAGTDDVIKESHTKKIAGLIEGSKLVFIEGDHFIAAKKSEQFNKTVLDFLK